jgi:hypothetical protein
MSKSNKQVISTVKELDEIIKSQSSELLGIRSEVRQRCNELESKGKTVTVISIQDENDGNDCFYVAGLKICNNIGYYVLEGSFELLDDYLY